MLVDDFVYIGFDVGFELLDEFGIVWFLVIEFVDDF